MDTTKDKRKALGRGLDSLLPSRTSTSAAPAPAPSTGTREIPLDSIDRNPYQTRGKLDEVALAELAASINVSGVLQPILVRPAPGNAARFQLIAGERRWLASQRAGKSTIPALVKQVSDEQVMEITIIENLQREDLNPVEQARAFERLSREFGLTQELIAARTGKDRATIANFLRLLKLPAMVQSAIEAGTLTHGHGKVLMMLSSQPAEMVIRVAQKAIDEAISVRQLEERVQKLIGPAREAQPKPEKHQDPNVRAAQQELQSTLGCRVSITDRGGKGKIVLEYASLEDFDRIVEVLGKKA